MKFLCLPCDQVMAFAERQVPGDGTFAAVFACPGCGREMAMLANPMETQLVSSLGVKVGGRTLPEQPMELTRGGLSGGRADAFADEEDAGGVAAGASSPTDGAGASSPTDGAGASAGPGGTGAPVAGAPRVVWSEDAQERLTRVPSFVRGMVKRIYADWAREHGVATITPEVMDRARTELGLEGM